MICKMDLSELKNAKIAIVGLGYVGLPLAIEFAKKYKVLGFDINESRINELKKGIDRTKEARLDELTTVMEYDGQKGLSFSSDVAELKSCNFYVVTVPTPINKFKS